MDMRKPTGRGGPLAGCNPLACKVLSRASFHAFQLAILAASRMQGADDTDILYSYDAYKSIIEYVTAS